MPKLKLGYGLGRGGFVGSAYPLGVIAAGLQTVYDYYTNSAVGVTQAFTNTYVPGVNIPAGWTEGTFASGVKNLTPPNNATWSLSNWNLTLGHVLGRGGGTSASFTQTKFNVPTWSQSAAFGESAYGNYSASYCTFDGTGMNYNTGTTGGRSPMAGIYNSSDVNYDHCKFTHAPMHHINGTMNIVTITDSLFTTFLHDPAVGAHAEVLFVGSGAWDLLRVHINTSAENTDPTEVYTTAIVYIEAQATDVSWRFRNGIIKGALTQGIAGISSAIQIAARAANKYAVAVVSGSAIEKGSSAYFGTTETGGGVVGIIDNGGNYDLNTGFSINVANSKKTADSSKYLATLSLMTTDQTVN